MWTSFLSNTPFLKRFSHLAASVSLFALVACEVELPNDPCADIDLTKDPQNCGSCGNSIDDMNECTDDSCVGGIPMHTNRNLDSFCTGGKCDSNGVCIPSNASSCTTNAQCESGFCVDGVCCNEACNGTCESCELSENGFANGTCGPIVAMTDPADECSAGECNGAGQCTHPANACTSPADCASGFCSDGYCCDSPCTESCMTCGSLDKRGICVPVPIFEDDPNGTFPCSGPMVACNGSGVCKGDIGQSCNTNMDCLTGHCDGGICGTSITQVGPLVREWHVEETVSWLDEFDYVFPDLEVSDMVAADDGRVILLRDVRKARHWSR